MRVLLAAICLVAVSGFRQRVQRKSNATKYSRGVTLKGADCDQLQNITVGGRDLGQAAVLLCRFWPASFGDFPVDNAKKIVDLFNGGHDLWKKIQDLIKGGANAPFCWKKMGTRELMSESHLTGLLHFNASELAVQAESDCDIQMFGKCYGNCPTGMKPAALIGSFSPVCSTACVQSSHDTPCGFGCATGVGQCVQVLMEQVSVVARIVGQVASYLAGNPAIAEVVNQVLRLAEFFIDIVFDVVRVAKDIWAQFPRGEAELGVIIAFVTFVIEHAKTIGKDLMHLQDMFGETMEMVLELINMEFEWKEINLSFIADTILKHGQAILGAGYELAEAFVYPTCVVKHDTNPDYDCDADGMNECRDWSYRGARCHDNGGQCEYRYKFGDFLLDHSCRCKNSRG